MLKAVLSLYSSMRVYNVLFNLVVCVCCFVFYFYHNHTFIAGLLPALHMVAEGDNLWGQDSELMRQLRGSSWEAKKYLYSTDWGYRGAERGNTRKGKEESRGCVKCGQDRIGRGRRLQGSAGGWNLGSGGGKRWNWTWRPVEIAIGLRQVGSPPRPGIFHLISLIGP